MLEMNPYQAPEVPAEAADVDRKARDLVRPPTLGLIVLSGIVFAGYILVVPTVGVSMFLQWLRGVHVVELGELFVRTVPNPIGNATFFTGSALVLYGAWQMRHLRSRRWGYAAAILALVPSPCFIVTALFGVWSLIVLRNPAVKEAFARQQNKQGVPDNGVGTP